MVGGSIATAALQFAGMSEPALLALLGVAQRRRRRDAVPAASGELRRRSPAGAVPRDLPAGGEGPRTSRRRRRAQRRRDQPHSFLDAPVILSRDGSQARVRHRLADRESVVGAPVPEHRAHLCDGSDKAACRRAG